MVKGNSEPMLLHRSPWARARWLVLAPHADDEVLGTGALISEMAARNALAGVVFLTDGSGSHPHAAERSRRRLIDERRREAVNAVRKLTGRSDVPALFFQWPDAHPPRRGEKLFDKSAQRLAALCRREAVDALAVTASVDPHCDHQAACNLAYAALQHGINRRITVFEYVVWADQPPGHHYRSVVTRPMLAGRRQEALRMHRSQLTPLWGAGFRVPFAMRAMPTSDTLYTKRIRHAA